MSSDAAGIFRYDALPVFNAFERVSDPAMYTPLPDDWIVGVADVVNSTDALESGRFKAVNMAGASIVAAVKNALAGLSFPFVFGGDGATLAVPAEAGEQARQAMAATVTYVAESLQLSLRAGVISVAAIRAAGRDMRVARYAASSEAIYAMFAGGGASYAEAELKAGRIPLDPAPANARPDLTGLSCRWSPLRSRRGVILSLVVLPAEGASSAAFQRAAEEVVRITQSETADGHPLSDEGPRFSLNLAALRTEAEATRKPPERFSVRLIKIISEMILGIALDRAGRTLGGFDPRRYRSWVTRNSDFRKYDDGLRMTIDCSRRTAAALDAFLAPAEAGRIVDYGLHLQDSALITCIVPSVFQDDHLHFLDGGGGGYAFSAKALKEKRAARELGAAAALA